MIHYYTVELSMDILLCYVLGSRYVHSENATVVL